MNKSKVLSISGWAQNPNSLDKISISFGNPQERFDYSKFSDIKDCFDCLKKYHDIDILIGWSLGGQIACRAIAQEIIKPKLLVLLATPFQFVKSPQIVAAMPKKTFDEFRNNFAINSKETLEKFSLLMMINDKKRIKELQSNLYINKDNCDNLLFWLDELERFSCYKINFNNFPRTLIFHGEEDVVVNVAQSKVFASKIENSQLFILQNCGHCPHISNFHEVSPIIQKEIYLIND